MEITHVVRADEHLSNTFPQLLVFEALGDKLPQFAHVPFVAEPGSKAKISKRKLAEYEKQGILIYLHQYIERGYLPDALLNYLVRLGWSYDASQEIFSRRELIEKFALEKVNSSPASHDPDKLFWIEGEWMKTLPLEQKVEGVVPVLEGRGPRWGAALVARESADRSRHPGAGRPSQGLFGYPQARPVLLHAGVDVRARRREEAAPQGGRCRNAGGDRRPAARRRAATTFRPSKRPFTTTPSGPAARWATWSTRCGWPSPGRGSGRGSTIAS